MTAGSGPYAVFTPCVQSHAFEERRTPLPCQEEHAIKIGRSVARLKPNVDNAIFDCKVLSRNHATMWYEDGRFYLRDTKSSNGTFVNNQRLSKGGEESAPTEIFSGDIIQFGVDIVENTKKVTHGCIIAMVRLFHSDGTEASIVRDCPDSVDSQSQMHTSMIASSPSHAGNALNSQELFQLQQYIREATHREQMLEHKLSTLQGLLASTQEASENSWQALINEDRLLSRIEMLESQLQMYSKSNNEDKMRDEVLNLHNEKEKYETVAKEALRRALQEKTEAIQKLFDVERSLETTEEECGRLREKCEAAHSELTTLSETHQSTVDRINQLLGQLQESESRYAELEAGSNAERAELERKLAELVRQETLLRLKIDSLQSDKDLSSEALAAATRHVEQMTAGEANRAEDSGDESLRQLSFALKESQLQADEYKRQMNEMKNLLDTADGQLDDVRADLRQAKQMASAEHQKASRIGEKLEESTKTMSAIVGSATSDLLTHLEISLFNQEHNEDLIKHLNEFASQLENRLKGVMASIDEASSGYDSALETSLSSDDDRMALEDQLAKALQAQLMSDTELDKYKVELSHAQRLQEKSHQEADVLRDQLKQTELLLAESAAQCERYRDQATKEKDLRATLHDELNRLKMDMEDTKTRLNEQSEEISHLKEKLSGTTEELAFERSVKNTSSMDGDNERIELHRQLAKHQADFSRMNEECDQLRQRTTRSDTELSSVREECCRLESENRQLHDSLDDLNRLKESLLTNETTWRDHVGSVKSEAGIVRNQLDETVEQLMRVQQRESQQAEEARNLRRRLEEAFDLEELARRSRTVMVVSAIPLILLFIALVAAFLPFFA
uniref:FHA domain-containing protein n=1 Tax=Plectus sambesii TaxID=2011161 RepID=A0A914VGV3_9BILA